MSWTIIHLLLPFLVLNVKVSPDRAKQRVMLWLKTLTSVFALRVLWMNRALAMRMARPVRKEKMTGTLKSSSLRFVRFVIERGFILSSLEQEEDWFKRSASLRRAQWLPEMEHSKLENLRSEWHIFFFSVTSCRHFHHVRDMLICDYFLIHKTHKIVTICSLKYENRHFIFSGLCFLEPNLYIQKESYYPHSVCILQLHTLCTFSIAFSPLSLIPLTCFSRS